MSLRAAGESVGLSETTFGRLERGQLAMVTVEQLALACAAVGLRFAARPYPDGDPIRDAGQLRLLDRLRDMLPDGAVWRTEVPLPIERDLRAWDAQIRLGAAVVAVEAEVRLSDIQALDRRIALKRRDGQVEVVILLIAGTGGNRRLLAQHREALRASYPLDTRAALASLRAERAPTTSGIVVL